jgi:hypothetical protein
LWIEKVVLMVEAMVEAAAGAATDIVAATTAAVAFITAATTGMASMRPPNSSTQSHATHSATAAFEHDASTAGDSAGAQQMQGQVAANPILGYTKAYLAAVVLQGERELLLRVLALVDTIEPAVRDMVHSAAGEGARAGAIRNARRVKRLYQRDYSAALYIAKMTAVIASADNARASSGVTSGSKKRR